MSGLRLSEVRNRCAEGRFFSYDDWRDRLFVPPSILLVWMFLRLGWSGNAVTLLSGGVALAGGVLMASSNPVLVVIGAFGYMGFYLLDYVDGGVARLRGQSGVGGQYVDWTMHVVSAVGISAGLFAGAVGVEGSWVIPFGVLTITAAALTLDRYSLGWFAICMHYQQQRARGKVPRPATSKLRTVSRPIFRVLRKLSVFIFHENYAIFILPALAVLQLFEPAFPLDFRVAIIVLGGVLYFPVVICDIWFIATDGRIDDAYQKLFFGNEQPRLPGDHFFY